ncbi:huntington interacting protein related 1 isoform X2 [Musca domestica]|nr:huntington interacting protein related 1 isoform X2 [Musca domestica]
MPQQQELTSNRFSMWKFCILMHKILHEGYEQILIDSYANIAQFGKLANFWSSQTTHHLAQCIIQYCKVLQRKIIFHQTYRHIKGNFECDYEKDLDINTTFQLCLDMCDYLEDLLDLQHLIFIDLTTNQIFPDSKQGLCRLTAFTTIMTECNLMYQHLVDVLRLLHSQLSPDYISGLSVRFNNVIFIQLRRFYEQVRSLPLSSNYFDVPVLPTESPIVTGVYYTTPAINRNSHEPSAPLITDLDY